MSLKSTMDANVTLFRETPAAAPRAQRPLTARRLVTGPRAVKVDSLPAKRVSGVTPQRGRC
ncbi:MAG: hypothetical protein HON54_01995 [Verrucomicrobia bacterium]|nr:hypothetical protein [Verrucomicrobiota bacterium]